MNRNLAIVMSGGTTTVISSTLAGIIEAARRSACFDRIFAGCPGIRGLMEGRISEITNFSDLNILRQTPTSSFIGATRLPALDSHDMASLKSVFCQYKIGFFINIGGNGTINQTRAIANVMGAGFNTVALPKTVDNDFGDSKFKTMYFTPGFPSCVRYWAHKMRLFNQENLGANQHDKVLVCQTFGRETGFIAGACRAADPDRELPLVILLPEDQQPLKRVLDHVTKVVTKHGRALVVLSEGYRMGNIRPRRDSVGQIMYGSSEASVAQLLTNRLNDANIQSRAFIPGFDQRDEILLTVQRDVEIASDVGTFAIKRLSEGESNFLVGISGTGVHSTKLIAVPLKGCTNYTRTMPRQWIDHGNFDVSDRYIKYLESLHDPKLLELEFDSRGFVKFATSRSTKSEPAVWAINESELHSRTQKPNILLANSTN